MKKKKVLQNPPKLDEKAHARSKEKKVVVSPVPCQFQFSVKPEGGSLFKPWTGKTRKKTVRLASKESIDDYFPELPVPQLDQPFPCVNLRFMEMQESFFARQRARREERNNILKQFEDLGYADVEIEVPDVEA